MSGHRRRHYQECALGAAGHDLYPDAAAAVTEVGGWFGRGWQSRRRGWRQPPARSQGPRRRRLGARRQVTLRVIRLPCPRVPPLANRKPRSLCYTPRRNHRSGDSNRPSEYAWRGIFVICQCSFVSIWLAVAAVVRVNFHRFYCRVASIECSFAHRELSRLTHDICKFCGRIRLIALAGGQPKESTGLRLGVAFSVACLRVSKSMF
jgi:hypothetical protein